MLINVEFEVLTLRHPANNQDIDSSKSLLYYIGHELHTYVLAVLLARRQGGPEQYNEYSNWQIDIGRKFFWLSKPIGFKKELYLQSPKALQSFKGQVISKCLLGVYTFSQKTNENKSTSSKDELFRSFFGRKCDTKETF